MVALRLISYKNAKPRSYRTHDKRPKQEITSYRTRQQDCIVPGFSDGKRRIGKKERAVQRVCEMMKSNRNITSTSRFANASWVKCTPELTPHRHHRLILDHIGKRLETFQCSKDMVSAIRATLTGAYPTLFTLLAV